MQQSARVAFGPHAMKTLGQGDAPRADRVLQLRFDTLGDGVRIAQLHRRVDACEERVQAIRHRSQYIQRFTSTTCGVGAIKSSIYRFRRA